MDVFFAVKERDISQLERWIEAGRSLDVRNEMGSTPLMVAVNQRDLDMVQLLVEHVPVNAQNMLGQTALYMATLRTPQIARVLLQHGADPDIPIQNGYTPLIIAAIRGRTLMTRLLLQYGADPDMQDTTKQTALHKAVWHRHDDVTALLLDAGADISIQDVQGRTPRNLVTSGTIEEMVWMA